MADNVTSGLQTGHAALALMLPAAATRQIAGWRAAYDPYHLTIPPHITVMYPPFVPPVDWSDERPGLARLLTDFPAFDITLATTGTFLAPNCVLWLNPEDRGLIRRLETTVREHFGLPPSPPPYPFTPHVTLGFFADEAALRRAELEINTTLTPVTFRAERAACLVYQPDRSWRLADEIPFGEVLP